MEPWWGTEGALNPAYYDVIRRLGARGVKFMACSGRQRLSIAKLFRPIEREIFYACDGGSMVYQHDRLLYARTFPRETAQGLILWSAVRSTLTAGGRTVNCTAG